MPAKITVELADRSYRISIGRGMLDKLGAECQKLKMGADCLLVTDRRVAELYGEKAEASLREAGFKTARIEIPPREAAKSRKWLFEIYQAALAHDMGRNSFIVALGGGVVGDLAGFAAATYMRGIRFIQAPTTLLAMVDSSVGGKTGINLPQGKNLIGAFHQPSAVFADLDTLDTLPLREYRSGLAEVVKYGIIEDACFFNRLEKNLPLIEQRDTAFLEKTVSRCCEIKAEVVRFDEKESGLRAILNFGHTFGHALENGCGYGKLLHGEAIAIGMVFAARLSRELSTLCPESVSRITGLLKALGLPIKPPAADINHLCDIMGHDKKNKGRLPAFVLARRIGLVEPGHTVTTAQLKKAWNELSPC